MCKFLWEIRRFVYWSEFWFDYQSFQKPKLDCNRSPTFRWSEKICHDITLLLSVSLLATCIRLCQGSSHSLKSLANWTSSVDCEVGFFSDVFTQLQKKIQANELHPECVLVRDGMKIKSSVIYNKSTGSFDSTALLILEKISLLMMRIVATVLLFVQF